jgi:hypothetical protein
MMFLGLLCKQIDPVDFLAASDLIWHRRIGSGLRQNYDFRNLGTLGNKMATPIRVRSAENTKVGARKFHWSS